MSKKKKMILLIFIIGIGTAIGIHIRSQNEFHLTDAGQIVRNKWGEGDYHIKLQAKTRYGEKEIDVKVSEQKGEQKSVREKGIKENVTDTEEKQFYEELEQEINRINREQKEDTYFDLPTNFHGIHIIWKEIKSPQELWMLLLSIVGALLVSYAFDYEEKKQKEIKAEYLRGAYTEFVEKLQMYLIAGLSTRNAFFTITKQYSLQKKRSKGQDILWKELLIVCNKLQNGIREEEVYAEWGKACGEKFYRKLSFLLIVNLKRGNQEMLSCLQKETYRNWELQQEQMKKQGEEASTKLLFPMALFLVVVMMLVIFPAYAKIGGI